MGNETSTAGGSNMFATGHTMYINDKGETITDTIRHYNGETVRSSETGKIPTTGGGFISQSLYTPWVPVVLAATVLLMISTVMFALMKQKLDKKKTRPIATVEDTLHSIPLYSLKKPKSHQLASGAKWNIDLLEEVDLDA